MCLDGNTAELSGHYINAQLVALWENAQRCATHAATAPYKFRSAAYEKSRSIRALYEYHYIPRKADPALVVEELFFSAKFGKPELKFICNHSAFFHLKIETGHLNIDVKEAEKPSSKARTSLNHNISSLEIVFHVPTIRSSIKGRDSRIGNSGAELYADLQVLKVDEAKLIMLNPDSTLGPEIRDALKFYMSHYLAYLKACGRHVFFDLPDFDNNKERTKSDFSRIRTHEIDGLLRSIQHEVKLLNKFDCDVLTHFYKAQWMIASAFFHAGNWGSMETCLASVCTDWIIGSEINSHFFINFEAPTIQLLCPQEVILKFRLKDIIFFKEGRIDTHSTPLIEFHDWTIAFTVKVFENDSGMIQLDFETARYCLMDSYYGEKIDNIAEQYIAIIVKFLGMDYLDILVSHSFHLCLGSSGAALQESEEYSEDWSSANEDETEYHRQRGYAMLWMERIQRMCIQSGFDEVIAISEASINRLLLSRLRFASIFQDKSDLFRLNITGLKIRLLTKGKAVLFIETEGYISVKKKSAQGLKAWLPSIWEPASDKGECERYTFEAVTLAYEVDLRLESHQVIKTHVEQVVEEYVKKTWWRTERRQVLTETTVEEVVAALRHLILDVKHVRLIPRLCDVAALENDRGHAEKLKTIEAYVLKYLDAFASYGHHILHTVSMATGAFANSLFSFTDVDFKVLTKRRIALSTSLRDRENVEAPIVMIYGMCTGRPLPALIDGWTLGLLPVGKFSVGTLSLSRRAFLERCVLRHLEAINARTTLVPQTKDVVDGQWPVSLTTWAEREERLRSARGCGWTQVASKEPNSLTYEWQNRDEWKHKHMSRGESFNSGNTEYALECYTRNTVRVPTAYNPAGMVVTVEGTSSIRVYGKTNEEEWKNKTIFSWSATVTIDASSGALKVSFAHVPPVLSYDRDQCSGQCSLDVAQLHKKHFSLDVKMFDAVVPTLKSALEQNWNYCTMGIQEVALREPVFTRKGDFVCELDLVVDPSPPKMLDLEAWKEHSGFLCEFRPQTQVPITKKVTVTPVNGSVTKGNGNGAVHANGNGVGNGNGRGLVAPALSPSVSTSTAASSMPATPLLDVQPQVPPTAKAAPPPAPKASKANETVKKDTVVAQQKA